ncbi:MAG: hypothetical protein JAY90_18560 [Candidatus Thiodiazotropha lotti]|nr:hypothetical protein [Candidatus Thiodiazotropha lotti]
MTRDITSAANTQAQSNNPIIAMMAYLDILEGALYFNTTPYTLTYSGDDYLGVGSLGSIDQIKEQINTKVSGISFQLSGVPPELVSVALGSTYKGRDCSLYLAFLDTDHALIADPVLMFTGRMDVMTIDMGETATISVSAESRLADWDRPRIRRYTNEDQQLIYSGDLGLEFVNQAADKEVYWGRATPK